MPYQLSRAAIPMPNGSALLGRRVVRRRGFGALPVPPLLACSNAGGGSVDPSQYVQNPAYIKNLNLADVCQQVDVINRDLATANNPNFASVNTDAFNAWWNAFLATKDPGSPTFGQDAPDPNFYVVPPGAGNIASLLTSRPDKTGLAFLTDSNRYPTLPWQTGAGGINYIPGICGLPGERSCASIGIPTPASVTPLQGAAAAAAAPSVVIQSSALPQAQSPGASSNAPNASRSGSGTGTSNAPGPAFVGMLSGLTSRDWLLIAGAAFGLFVLPKLAGGHA